MRKDINSCKSFYKKTEFEDNPVLEARSGTAFHSVSSKIQHLIPQLATGTTK